MFITAGFAVVIALILGWWLLAGRTSVSEEGDSTPPLISRTLLGSLPRKSASSADTSHLAAGLQPPTNMWLSGMVLQQRPQVVYPSPLSFKAQASGFELGLPTINTTATTITGSHVPGIVADLGATDFVLTKYDKLSATLTYRRDNQPLGSLTLSEGSPFVDYRAQADTTIALSALNPSDILEQGAHYVRYRSNGHVYALYGAQASVRAAAAGIRVMVPAGKTVSFYALPGSTDLLKPYAGAIFTSVAVSHQQQGNTVRTTFSFKTGRQKPTVFVVPAYEHSDGKVLGEYPSIYGPMRAYAGTRFTTTVPSVTPSASLDLTKLTAAHKHTLTQLLAQDVAATTIDKQDSYYAGKQLARAANLLDIAEQLHDTASATKLKTILHRAFASRLTSSYFYYDTKLHGVTAANIAFGAQNFNDHHFHYGYWLYAGSIVGKYDPGFVQQYESWLNLLAADIADYRSGDTFPQGRYYDPYAAHSWADGLAPFADGNDQESSSEAMHAWNGVALWGQVTHNSALAQTGSWMLAGESHTAATTWRTVNTSTPALRSYTSPVVGIAFGGKRTYSTWFSDDPAAKLGIQLIPMDPGMAASMAGDGHIRKTITASIPGDNFNVALGDYALMYLALANPQQAAQLLSRQTVIDDGDSATYLHAFIFAQLDSRA